MKTLYSLFALLLLVTLCGYIALIWYVTPKKIETTARNIVLANGFSTFSPEKSFHSSNQYTLENITLDPDNLVQIGSMNLHYSPVALALNNHIDRITINGLRAIGDLNLQQPGAKNGSNKVHDPFIKVTGFSPSDFQGLVPSFGTLEIKDAALSLLNPLLGGVSVNADILLSGSHKGEHDQFHYTLESRQKKISLSFKGSGATSQTGDIQTIFDLQRGKLEIEPLMMTRISGSGSASWKDTGHFEFFSEFRAGFLAYHDLSWQNVTGGLTLSANSFDISINAQGATDESSELSLSLTPSSNNLYNVQGSAFFPSLSSLDHFLTTYGYSPTLPESYAKDKAVILEFDTAYGANDTLLRINLLQEQEEGDHLNTPMTLNFAEKTLQPEF